MLQLIFLLAYSNDFLLIITLTLIHNYYYESKKYDANSYEFIGLNCEMKMIFMT